MAEVDVMSLRKRIPENRSEFFIGFSPWSEDCQDWQRSVRERFEDDLAGPLLRTVWDDPENRNTRVLIDIVELSSAIQAMDALAQALKLNQLAQLPEGPSDLGYASFVHPPGVHPAAFSVHGNAFVSVISFASQPVDVVPWAYRLARRLLDRPRERQSAIGLETGRTSARIGEPFPVRYTLPWRLGDDGFVKIFAAGAVMTREKGQLSATATRSGEIVFEIFAVEPGRETYAGQLRLPVE
jgi:hypothetical protein